MNNHFRVAKTSQRRHLGFKFEAMWMRHAEIEEAIEKKKIVNLQMHYVKSEWNSVIYHLIIIILT